MDMETAGTGGFQWNNFLSAFLIARVRVLLELGSDQIIEINPFLITAIVAAKSPMWLLCPRTSI